jgi:hypothetical protein
MSFNYNYYYYYLWGLQIVIYRKILQHMSGVFLLLIVYSAHAAAVTYNVTTGTYGPGTGTVSGTFSDSMSLSGSFTLDSPLAPNLNRYDFTGMVTSYSFNNGVDTFTSRNSVFYPGEISVNTDDSGEITDIEVNIISPPPPHSSNPATVIDFMGFDWEGGALGDVDGADNANCTDVVGGLCDDADSLDGEVAIEDVPLTLTKSSASTVDLSGTVQNPEGEPLCAMVLASGKYVFSCNPNGPYSLTDLGRENDSTVKRQVYVDGFFPNIEVLQGSTQQTVTMQRAGECPDYNQPYTPSSNPDSAGERVTISGMVLLQNSGTPVCAMVLANGQYIFSCDGTGNYALDIPLDNNGQYKLQVYADGFAPYVIKYDERSVMNDVRLARDAQCK